MKTTEEIRDYLRHQISSMIKRPLMWADTAVAFEMHYLSLIELWWFIEGGQYAEPRAVYNAWRKFAHKEIGYSGPTPVASFLKREEKLDDGWINLATLLVRFTSYLEGNYVQA